MNEALVEKTRTAVDAFCGWLDRYGETSYDHQSFFASKLGRSAKALYYRKPLLGTLAVSPMIFCEAFLPSARRLFWKPATLSDRRCPLRHGLCVPVGDLRRRQILPARRSLPEVLQETRCPGYEDYCWGYPFDWQTRTGTMTEDTPLITTVPYVYEAFSQVYAIDRDRKWLRIMRSIAEHAFKGYRDMETGPDSASCGYTPAPDDPGWRDQRERLSGISADQGGDRTLGAEVSGGRAAKHEFRH